MAVTGQIVYAPCARSTELGDEEGETVGSMTGSISSKSRLGKGRLLRNRIIEENFWFRHRENV